MNTAWFKQTGLKPSSRKTEANNHKHTLLEAKSLSTVGQLAVICILNLKALQLTTLQSSHEEQKVVCNLKTESKKWLKESVGSQQKDFQTQLMALQKESWQK